MIHYLPILILLVIAAGFAVTNIGLSAVLGRRKSTTEKLMPYECGIDPVGSARERFFCKVLSYRNAFCHLRYRSRVSLSVGGSI